MKKLYLCFKKYIFGRSAFKKETVYHRKDPVSDLHNPYAFIDEK